MVQDPGRSLSGNRSAVLRDLVLVHPGRAGRFHRGARGDAQGERSDTPVEHRAEPRGLGSLEVHPELRVRYGVVLVLIERTLD